jgi:hypothetical protein
MKRTITTMLMILVAATSAAAHDYEFSGQGTPAEIGQYLYLEFEVPAGTTKIDFAYSYASAVGAAHVSGATTGLLFGSVIDIGVFDPDGYRGWSGSNKRNFSIAESASATTDSYIPGTLQEGTWKVELGVGWIEPGDALDYQVTIDFSSSPVGTPFTPVPYTPVVLSDQPGWYKGDLHCHSSHSDGSETLGDTLDYAHSRGLDFIAVTDHNAISHWLYLPEHQADYADMLLVYGVEVTAYTGHVNMFGVHEYIPYQGTAPGYDINEVIDQVHALGGYVSPNHPFIPGIPNFPSPGLIYGMGWGFVETDWSKVDFLEGINGPTWPGSFQYIGNLGNLALWDILQNMGYSIPIRGGSDDHRGGTGSGDDYAPIGTPCTVVYAEELSEAAILEAIAAGHNYISTSGPDGPELYLEASSDKTTVMMGDTIAANYVELTARVVNGQGMTLDLLAGGGGFFSHVGINVDSQDFTYSIDLEPGELAQYRAELWDNRTLMAITNSIWIRNQGGCEDDGIWCNGTEYRDGQTDECVHSGDPCKDDGIWCNGIESCEEENGQCVHSGDPCTPGDNCDEQDDSCSPIDDDDDDDDVIDDDDDSADSGDDDDDSGGGCCG